MGPLRRLPTYFANLPLKLQPLKEAEQKAYESTGFISRLVFRTIPSANKLEIKSMLERLYGLNVREVRTANYEGRKKRSKSGFFRRPDFKKAYVFLQPPAKEGK
ncbi:hypothetical protein WJX72_001510 [[Myrmecia] bisecta]|uniref:Large ribosomal subunit protein uL23c n=1 Tax=[Myrmecia] bisecta TaxID=41462 RepID=A0AAW1R4J6_9CHLO